MEVDACVAVVVVPTRRAEVVYAVLQASPDLASGQRRLLGHHQSSGRRDVGNSHAWSIRIPLAGVAAIPQARDICAGDGEVHERSVAQVCPSCRAKLVERTHPRYAIVAYGVARRDVGASVAYRGYRHIVYSQVAAGEGTPEGQTQPHSKACAEPRTLRSSLVTNLLALLFLLCVFLWNLTAVSPFNMPERVVSLGTFLGLNQSWNMFTPYPAKNDGWYVIPGTLRNEQQVDLMPAVMRYDFRAGEEVSWEKPRYVAGTLNVHWRKYMEKIGGEDYADQRQYFGHYICREWNARHTDSEQLMDLQITFMQEVTLPNYKLSTPQKEVLGTYSCF